MCVEDMVQTHVSVPSDVGIQPSNSGAIGSLCFNESKDRDFEKLTDLLLTPNVSRKTQQGIGARFRENLSGDVCARSLQQTFNTAWPEYRGGCRPGDGLGIGDQIAT